MSTALKVHLKNINGDQLHPYTTNVPIGQQFSFSEDKLQLNYDIVKAKLGISSDSLSFSLPEQTFTSAPDNQLILSGLPVGIKTNKGNYYPVQKTTVTITGTDIILNLQNYLIYDNSSEFSGAWTVYYASGRNGTDGLTPYIDSQTKTWVIGDTDTGVCADILLAGSTVVIPSAQDSLALIQGSSVPVGVLTDKGNYYPVQKNSITINAAQNQIQLDLSPYLAYDGSTSFSGPWTCYLAAGASKSAQDNSLVYGIDHDTSISTSATACKRVLLNLQHDSQQDALRYTQVSAFNSMPAHNLRRCVMSDLANRTVAYYLDADDSRFKQGGGSSVLTGGDGDVMVQIPVTYYRIDTYNDGSGHTHNVYLVSATPFTGSKPHPFFYVSPSGATLRTQYVGAFHSVLCDSASLPKEQSNASTPAAYQQGDKLRSIAGARSAATMTRAQFRAGSQANGSTNVNVLFVNWMILMMAIDGGSFNSQQSISYGYTQLSVWDYAAIRKTGRTAVFGNHSGNILADDTGSDSDLLTMNAGQTMWHAYAQADPSRKVVQFSWRGIQDPFGSLWTNPEGIQRNQNSDSDDYSQSGYWITTDTQKYTDMDTDLGYGEQSGVFPQQGYTGQSKVWVHYPFLKTSGYISEFDVRSFMPAALDGNNNLSCGDYYYNKAISGYGVIFTGGCADSVNRAGVSALDVRYNSVTTSSSNMGSRISA